MISQQSLEYDNISHSDSLLTFCKWLATFHNYAFVLISGYIYAFIKFEKSGYNNFLYYAIKKAKRLLIPFFIVGYCWVFPIRGLYLSYTVKQFLINFVLGINPGQLWFLFMLFWVCIIVDLIIKIFRNDFNKSGIFIMLIYYSGIIIGGYLPNIFQCISAMQFLPYFWGGVLLRNYIQYINNQKEKQIIAIASFLNIGLFLVSQSQQFNFINETIMVLFGNLICTFSGAIAAFFILERLARIVPWNNKFGLFLCKVSFPIYLFHEQLIYYIAPSISADLNPIIATLIIFITVFFLTALLSNILIKKQFAKIMLGMA